jgi:presenilin-like A22 family membrane protease
MFFSSVLYIAWWWSGRTKNWNWFVTICCDTKKPPSNTKNVFVFDGGFYLLINHLKHKDIFFKVPSILSFFPLQCIFLLFVYLLSFFVSRVNVLSTLVVMWSLSPTTQKTDLNPLWMCNLTSLYLGLRRSSVGGSCYFYYTV